MAIPCTYHTYELTKFIKNHTYSFDPTLFFVYKFQLRNLSNEGAVTDKISDRSLNS
jgi:hypothetical protein